MIQTFPAVKNDLSLKNYYHPLIVSLPYESSKFSGETVQIDKLVPAFTGCLCF